MTKNASTLGHAAHTQAATARGLDGVFARPVNFTFLGAGSFFAPRLVNDLLRIPGHRGGTIALVDIDPQRLRITTQLIDKLLRDLDERDWKLVAATERTEVLAGAHYVVNCIEVSGA